MSLPPFLDRAHNAAGPLLGDIARSEFGAQLEASTLVLEIDGEVAAHRGQRAGYLLAVNLGARLYPNVHLVGPADLVAEAEGLAQAINPFVDLAEPGEQTLTLSWRGGRASARRVTVRVAGWNLGLDGSGPNPGPAEPLAAMAAASLGIGELFRALFADRLPQGRRKARRYSMNLITLQEESEVAPLPDEVDLGEFHLAGCGAVGQAFVAALRELPVTGRLVAVDHDALDQGNLQRYVLGDMAALGTAKPSLVAAALAGGRLEVEQVPTRWGADVRTGPGRDTIICALDSKQGRIELQAGLPRRLYNAWTQPEDLGVSRHESFGEEPCLACLAWPRQARPSESERIADALGEDELRVAGYLLQGVPVGAPLAAPMAGTIRLPASEDAARWTERSLLEDLAERFAISPPELNGFAGLSISDLYRDVVCAGILLEHRLTDDREVSVPLAHQSALAGILLATWLVAREVPALSELLPAAPQARYDVLRGGFQIWSLLQARQPGCICFDPDFVAVDESRWG